jgi:ATP-dependent RNA helicase DeaD
MLAELGFLVPTPIQAQAIPALLRGRDIIGQARTGSGKTLAFALPIVDRCDAGDPGVQSLVLVPTRELAMQVGGVISQLAAAHRLQVTLLYGGRSLLPERQALMAGTHVVVGTPGRTLDHLRRGDLRLGQLRILVLDEGDEMLDRGFAPDVERILARTPAERQTALFSATVPDWVAITAARHLRDPIAVRADVELAAPPEIQHVVHEMELSAKLDTLTRLLDRRADTSVLVFGRTKHGVKKLARQLGQKGYPAGALQGNLSQNARERVLAAFRSGELPILCATNVAARGLDIEGIGQVINYELPESAELLTHRVGRTGRMGRKGEAITFVTPEDASKIQQFERMLGCRLPRTSGSSHHVPGGGVAGAPPVSLLPPLVSPRPAKATPGPYADDAGRGGASGHLSTRRSQSPMDTNRSEAPGRHRRARSRWARKGDTT